MSLPLNWFHAAGSRMKVTVFGASGQLGHHVVTVLLADGHDVTAYVRNPSKLLDVDPRPAVVTGELSALERVREAVHGADAVISALGPSLSRGAKGTPV